MAQPSSTQNLAYPLQASKSLHGLRRCCCNFSILRTLTQWILHFADIMLPRGRDPLQKRWHNYTFLDAVVRRILCHLRFNTSTTWSDDCSRVYTGHPSTNLHPRVLSVVFCSCALWQLFSITARLLPAIISALVWNFIYTHITIFIATYIAVHFLGTWYFYCNIIFIPSATVSLHRSSLLYLTQQLMNDTYLRGMSYALCVYLLILICKWSIIKFWTEIYIH